MTILAQRGYRVLNYDARGHGDSEWSPVGAYHLDDRVNDLRCIVEQIDGPFALVGASLGGATIIHAVAGGMIATAVVLVDIVPDAEEAGIERIIAFMRANADGFASLDDAATSVAAYNPDRPRPASSAGLQKNLRLQANGRWYWHWDPRISSGEPGRHREVVKDSARTMARQLPLPTLLVRGLKSDVVSDTGVAAFRRLLPHLEVADVGEAGHMVAGDRNDAFSASVIDFLSRTMPALTAPPRQRDRKTIVIR
jgi:pimeloyl-ACP methyl ester carboxylesterase